MECANCGVEVERTGRRGPIAKLCEGCRAPVYASKVCLRCGQGLPAKRDIRKVYCSPRCGNTAWVAGASRRAQGGSGRMILFNKLSAVRLAGAARLDDARGSLWIKRAGMGVRALLAGSRGFYRRRKSAPRRWEERKGSYGAVTVIVTVTALPSGEVSVIV